MKHKAKTIKRAQLEEPVHWSNKGANSLQSEPFHFAPFFFFSQTYQFLQRLDIICPMDTATSPAFVFTNSKWQRVTFVGEIDVFFFLVTPLKRAEFEGIHEKFMDTYSQGRIQGGGLGFPETHSSQNKGRAVSTPRYCISSFSWCLKSGNLPPHPLLPH